MPENIEINPAAVSYAAAANHQFRRRPSVVGGSELGYASKSTADDTRQLQYSPCKEYGISCSLYAILFHSLLVFMLLAAKTVAGLGLLNLSKKSILPRVLLGFLGIAIEEAL